MALGIIEPKGLEPPPGTEYLIDTERTAIDHQPEHTLFKHGKGSVSDKSIARVPTGYRAYINPDRGHRADPTALRQPK